MILETLTLLGDATGAAQLAKQISDELSKNEWMSTQTTAYSLLAISKFAGKNGTSGQIDAVVADNGGKQIEVNSRSAIVQQPLSIGSQAAGGSLVLTNKTTGIAYARIIMKGTPAVGQEKANSQGIVLGVKYLTKSGNDIDPSSIPQGTDLVAEVTISTQSGSGPFKQIALSQIFPSGWEIRNARFEGKKTEQSEYTYQDIRDDRVYTYFDLNADESKQFRIELNAAYLGKYYLPMVYAEAMYDASINAAVPGKWITVNEPGK
jgi:hypothetical protein